MTFKKSSFPLIFTAILCFVIGLGLIILCFLFPSGNDYEDPDPENEIVNNDPQQPSVPDEGNGDEVEPGEALNPETPTEPSEPDVPDEPVDPQIPSEPDVPDEPSEGEKPFVSSKDDPLLVLANVDNPLPDDFEVGELELVQKNSQGTYKLDIRAASYAREMIADAEADGISLFICSSYRARSLQQTLFDNKYNSYIANGWSADEAYAKTATIIAIPGTSEHQTGLCMDIVTPSYRVLDAGYADTDAAKWLAENAYKYGFILRYPKDKQEITKIIFEPWHYRFVGIENAKLIKDSGLCLEEYLETLE